MTPAPHHRVIRRCSTCESSMTRIYTKRPNKNYGAIGWLCEYGHFEATAPESNAMDEAWKVLLRHRDTEPTDWVEVLRRGGSE